jgi:hypothetical protein
MPKSELIENKTVRSLFKKAARTERIAFRLSRQEKTSIRKAAKSVNATITNYLLNLHRFAVTPMSNARPTVLGEGTG